METFQYLSADDEKEISKLVDLLDREQENFANFRIYRSKQIDALEANVKALRESKEKISKTNDSIGCGFGAVLYVAAVGSGFLLPTETFGTEDSKVNIMAWIAIAGFYACCFIGLGIQNLVEWGHKRKVRPKTDQIGWDIELLMGQLSSAKEREYSPLYPRDAIQETCERVQQILNNSLNKHRSILLFNRRSDSPGFWEDLTEYERLITFARTAVQRLSGSTSWLYDHVSYASGRRSVRVVRNPSSIPSSESTLSSDIDIAEYEATSNENGSDDPNSVQGKPFSWRNNDPAETNPNPAPIAPPVSRNVLPSHERPAPAMPDDLPKPPEKVFRQAARITDWEKLNALRKKIGIQGEEIVLELERQFLIDSGRADLAGKIRHVSVEDGDGRGYDILSCFLDGKPKYIEVKTTTKGIAEPFQLSKGEYDLLRVMPELTFIYRLSTAESPPLLKVFSGTEFMQKSNLTPTQYLVKMPEDSGNSSIVE